MFQLICRFTTEEIRASARALVRELRAHVRCEVKLTNGALVTIERFDNVVRRIGCDDPMVCDLYVISGPTGVHRLNVSCTDEARLQAHVLGFIEVNEAATRSAA